MNLGNREMQRMLSQMNARPLAVEEVIIKTKDKTMTLKKPQVVQMSVMGQQSFQIIGIVEEKESPKEGEPGVNEKDIELVMMQTGATRERAIDALKNSKDLAHAILKLEGEE